MKTMLIILGVLLILLMIGYVFVFPHLWFKGNSEAIIVDGVNPFNAEIYESRDGEILFRYSKAGSYEDYVIRREFKELGLAGSDFIPLLFSVYSKELRPPVVLSTNRIKIERDIAVNFQAEFVEFTTSDNKRIKIDFAELSK